MAFLNVDISGRKRGRCKEESCDCDGYQTKATSDSTLCLMCGCFPAKHIKLFDADGGTPNPQKDEPLHLDILQKLSPGKTAMFSINDGTLDFEGIQSNSGSPSSTVTVAVSPQSSKKTPRPGTLTRQNAFCLASRNLNDVFSGSDDNSNKHDLGKEEDADQSTNNTGATDTAPGVSNKATDVIGEGPKSSSTPQTSKNDGTARERMDLTCIRFHSVDKPVLSLGLADAIKKDGVFAHEIKFYAECSSHLVSLCGSMHPTQPEWNLYCSKVIELYPELKTSFGATPWASVKVAMSRHLTNRRYLEAKSKKKISPRGIIPRGINEGVEPNFELQHQDVESAIAKLKNLLEPVEPEEVKYLLRVTLKERRQWMTTSSSLPFAVLEEWPHMRNVDWLKMDFLNLVKMTSEQFEGNFRIFIERIGAMMNENTEENDPPKPYEVLAAQSLESLVQRLCGRKMRKATKVLTVVKSMDNLDILTPLEGESPRLVLYTSNEQLVQAYVILDRVKLEIKNPTVKDCIQVLLALYYLIDIKYPTPYQAFLVVLDREILSKASTPKSKIQDVVRFYREYGASNVPV